MTILGWVLISWACFSWCPAIPAYVAGFFLLRWAWLLTRATFRI